MGVRVLVESRNVLYTIIHSIESLSLEGLKDSL